MRLMATLVVTAAALAPAVASAQDGFSWTGFYVGANIGVAGLADGSELSADDTTIHQDTGGLLAGVQGGFDYQIGQFVLGAVAGFDLSDIEADYLEAEDGPDEVRVGEDINWLATLEARGGFLIFNNLLAYAHGGIAFADIELVLEDFPVSESDSKTRTGFVIGAGVDVRVTDLISVGTEYGYYEFGEEEYDFEGETLDIENSFHTIRLEANFHF